ncbi:MAG: NUDIX hydrolase [Gammaproteobacteria bacterium]|nr:NUDIX hydrolase [Gammaproteobacteria bacterium]
MADRQPATPVPAATILMLRHAPEGLEVFMVVRHRQIDFASGALVFPGGKADPADFDPNLREHLDGAFEGDMMRAIQVASIRESFEECGILLARAGSASGLLDGNRLAELEPYRQRLNDGELTMLEFVTRENLRLACDRLTHFAHWITPPMVPKRFDTHFFLALAPDDHVAMHDGHESVDSVWIRPADVLADAENGERTVIFPTLRNIEKLGRHVTPEAAIAAAREASPPVTVLPWTERRDDGTYLCIPPEAGYESSEWKMPDPEPG